MKSDTLDEKRAELNNLMQQEDELFVHLGNLTCDLTP